MAGRLLGIVVLGPADVLADHAVEHGVPRQAGRVADIPLAVRPVHELAAAEVGVAAQLEHGPRPVAVQVLYQMAHQSVQLHRFAAAPWTQYRQDQAPRCPVEDQQRHVAVLVVVGVEQRQLLTAVGVGVGVVRIQHHLLRRLGEGGHILVHEQLADPVERHRAHTVLQASHRRLRGKVGVVRPAANAHLQGTVTAKPVAVVGILIAAHDLTHALAHHLGIGVDDQVLVAAVGYQGRKLAQEAAL